MSAAQPLQCFYRQTMLHQLNLCCSICGMKEVLSKQNTLYLGLKKIFFLIQKQGDAMKFFGFLGL